MPANEPRLASAADLAAIARFNQTDAPFPDDVTITALAEAQAARNATRTAVRWTTAGAESAMTFAELHTRANRLAHRLRANGVGPETVVALMVERSPAMVVGILGVLKAGAAWMPIGADCPVERAEYLLRDAAAGALLVHGRTPCRPAFAGVTLDLDDALYSGPVGGVPRTDAARNLAYVIYTSGSTGKPKGVMVEHRSLVNRLHWMQSRYPIGPGDVILQKTPYTFDVSVWELLWWALHGATVSLLAPGDEWNPPALLATVARHRVTVMHFVPSMLGVFLEYLEADPRRVAPPLASVRRVFASGEALTAGHVQRFNRVWGRHTGTRLTNLYGPTEATVDVTYHDCRVRGVSAPIPIGRPIHNTRLYIMRDRHHVAIGETGELCIAGVALARGYLNNPLLTEQQFVPDPSTPGERMYRTGDLARWHPDGTVEYLGREDQQVKIRGVRIELGEIESTMREFPGVRDAVVTVQRPSESVALIVAHAVCAAGTDLAAVKRFLQRRLPAYMVPHRIDALERLPVTSSGKADRAALSQPSADMERFA